MNEFSQILLPEEFQLIYTKTLVEGVSTLAHILRKYSVHLPEDLNGEAEIRKQKGETFEEKVKRVIKCHSVIVLTPEKCPLIFRER